MSSAGNFSPGGGVAPGTKKTPRAARRGKASRNAENDTRTRILDTAERLFAERGYAAVSMRMITGESGVNLAAANYHFGSKAGLFEAVFARRIVPINEHRLKLLDACLAAAGDRRPSLHGIAEAYTRPLAQCDRTAEDDCEPVVVMQLLAKVFLDLFQHDYLLAYYEDMSGRFIDAIQRALPDLRADEIVFKYNSMVAVLVLFALGQSAQMVRSPVEGASPGDRGDDAARDDEQALRRMIAFIGSGMAAESG